MRNFKKDLLLAIPALLAMAGAVVIAILGRDRQEISDRYLVRARVAQASEDYAWALMCYRKAELLSGGDVQIAYDKAICQAKARPEDGRKTMESIAIEGHIPARIWLAREKLKTRMETDELKKIEADMDAVIAEIGDSKKAGAENNKYQAMQLAALVKIQTKGPEASINYLKQLAKVSVVEQLRLAKVYEVTGRTKEAADEAAQVLDNSTNAVKRKAEDTDARLLGVDACYVLKDFRRAVALLGEGIRNQGQDPRLMSALSTTYLVWSDEESKAPAPKLENVLELLLLSTRFAPVNRHVYERLARFSRKRGEAGDAARKAMISSLAKGQTPALAHILLGTLAYDPKNTEPALKHWQLAADVDPKSYVTMSNLAIGLIEMGDKETALALIDKALLIGDEPQMHDTRARVLVKFDKYSEALVELEKAMKGLPDNWLLRQQAAEICRKLKKPEEADKYAREGAKLQLAAQAPKKDPAKEQVAEGEKAP